MMTQAGQPVRDPRVQHAAAELERLIRAGYPQATFELVDGEDPPGTRLRVTVDIDDVEPVRQLYLERLVDLQVEDGIPIYVRTVQPPHRWNLDARTHEASPTQEALAGSAGPPALR